MQDLAFEGKVAAGRRLAAEDSRAAAAEDSRVAAAEDSRVAADRQLAAEECPELAGHTSATAGKPSAEYRRRFGRWVDLRQAGLAEPSPVASRQR